MTANINTAAALLSVLAFAGDNEAMREAARREVTAAAASFMKGDSRASFDDTAAALASRKGAKAKEAAAALNGAIAATVEAIASGVKAGHWGEGKAPRVKGGRASGGAVAAAFIDQAANDIGATFIATCDAAAAARKEAMKAAREANKAGAAKEAAKEAAAPTAAPMEAAAAALKALPDMGEAATADLAQSIIDAMGHDRAAALVAALSAALSAAPAPMKEAAKEAASVEAASVEAAPKAPARRRRVEAETTEAA